METRHFTPTLIGIPVFPVGFLHAASVKTRPYGGVTKIVTHGAKTIPTYTQNDTMGSIGVFATIDTIHGLTRRVKSSG